MKNTVRKPFYKTFIVWGFGIFLMIFPYVTYLHLAYLSQKDAMLFPNTQGYAADFFLYTKEISLLCFAVFLIFYFIGEHIFPDHVLHGLPLEQKCARGWILPAGIYAVCIVASMIRGAISGNGRAVLYGSPTEYEGGIALLSCLVLFLFAYHYISDEAYADILVRCVEVFLIISAVLAAVEYFYQPIYEFSFVKYLIAPAQYREIAESMQNVYYQGQVALGVYNPGYLGGLAALLFPLAFGDALKTERRRRRVIAALSSTGAVFLAIVSNSTGALCAWGISLFLFLVFWHGGRKRKYQTFGILFAVCAAGLAVLGCAFHGKIMKTAVDTLFHKEKTVLNDRMDFTSMQLDSGILLIKTDKHTYQIRCEEPELSEIGLRQDGTQLSPDHTGKTDAGVCAVYDTADGTVTLSIEDGLLFLDMGYLMETGFYISEDGLKLAGLNGTVLDEIPQSSMDGFSRFYSAATGRGYIWLNTLPLLGKNIFLGAGPGCFAYEFPQNQVADLLKVHGSSYFLIDKPHDWYLQMAVNTGVVSAAAVVYLLLRYIRRGFLFCVREKTATQGVEIFPFVIAVIAFGITGIVNDSCVAANPCFWIIFGAACSRLEAYSAENK